jgi:hypothetical protein
MDGSEGDSPVRELRTSDVEDLSVGLLSSNDGVGRRSVSRALLNLSSKESWSQGLEAFVGRMNSPRLPL